MQPDNPVKRPGDTTLDEAMLGNSSLGALSQAIAQTLLESVPEHVFIKDLSSQYVTVNARFAATFGLKPHELTGKSDFDLFPKTLAENHRNHDQQVFARKQAETVEAVFSRADDSPLRVLVTKTPVLGPGGEPIGLIGVFTDTTESHRQAAELKRSEEQFRLVWEHSHDGMRISDENGLVVLVNHAFCRMVGKPREELEGKPFSVIYKTASQSAMQAKHKERFASRNIEPLFERELQLWNGGRVWFELSNSFIEVEGQPPHLLSIFRDITERKKAEEKMRIFATRLEQSNRELQDFAYIASHDLQEPLRKVIVFGDRVKTRYGTALGVEGCDYLDRMLKASERMQSLINGLLSFSRVTSKAQPFVQVDLKEAVEEILGDLETRIEQVGATVEIGSLPTIEAEPLQMRQLFQNLIGNALKFHRSEVKPLIKVECASLPQPRGPGNEVRDMVQLTVTDNGIGFEEKYAERIFQVFQRLHSRTAYEGTGMGLAIARKIAEYHSGSIVAKSQPGVGSTFVITLPVKQAQPTDL